MRLNPRAQVCEASRCEDSQTGFLSFAPSANVFYYIEWVSVVIFTLEYCVRVSTCPAHRRLAFVLTVTNLIDLIAWLPFWFIGAAQVLGDERQARPCDRITRGDLEALGDLNHGFCRSAISGRCVHRGAADRHSVRSIHTHSVNDLLGRVLLP